MRRFYLWASIFLVGCAPSYTWQNPALNPVAADKQLTIDEAECNAYGKNSVTVPNRTAYPIPAPVSPPSNTNTSLVPITDANGNVYMAQMQTVTNSMTTSDLQIQSAQAQANFQSIQDDARVNEAYTAQDQLAEACMVKRGWQKVAVVK